MADEYEGRGDKWLEAARVVLKSHSVVRALDIIWKDSWLGSEIAKRIGVGDRSKLSRRTVLEWLYSAPDPVLAALTYTRAPSRAKLLLVNELVGRVRRRSGFRWMTSRLLHAYAFRPDYFDGRRYTQLRETAHGPTWGPLYRQVRISSGGGRRRALHVPNPPLKLVQRQLLTILRDPIQAELAAMTTDRILVARSVFENVTHHLGQRYVVTLDIRRFFDSVRFDDVVGALLALEEPLWRIPKDAEGANRLAFQCDQQAAVLVAGLTTYRRRLPQGAPTSPILADLVFSSVDRTIRELLDAQLGWSSRYSRYFDDITISLPADTRVLSKSSRITRESEARDAVTAIVREALCGTPFQLSERKTVAADITRSSINVTGLRLRKEEISVSRELRRYLRGLLHRVEREGLWRSAKVGTKRGLLMPARYDAKRCGFFAIGRNLSQERLLANALKDLCPDLTIEVWSASSQASSEERCREGASARRSAERIFRGLWREQLQAVPAADGCILIIERDARVAQITAAKNQDVFLLSSRDAQAVLELWLRLKGLSAFLLGAPQDRATTRIAEMAEELQRAFSSALIRFDTQVSPDDVERARKLEVASKSSVDDPLQAACSELRSELVSFAKTVLGEAETEGLDQRASQILARYRKGKSGRKILDSLASLFRDLSHIPGRDALKPTRSLTAIDVWYGLENGLRSEVPRYRQVLEPITRLQGRPQSAEMKTALALSLAQELRDEVNRASDRERIDWIQGLTLNTVCQKLEWQFTAEFEQLHAIVKRAAEALPSTRRLPREALEFLQSEHGTSLKVPERESGRRWEDKLFRIAQDLVKNFLEPIPSTEAGKAAVEAWAARRTDPRPHEPALADRIICAVAEESEDTQVCRRRLNEHVRPLVHMRNRAAHQGDERSGPGSQPWMYMQRWWRIALGKDAPSRNRIKRGAERLAMDRLDPTTHEVNLLKLHCLEVTARILYVWTHGRIVL